MTNNRAQRGIVSNIELSYMFHCLRGSGINFDQSEIQVQYVYCKRAQPNLTRLINKADMKHLRYIISLFLLFALVACSGAGDKSDASSIDPSESIVHEDGWSIIPKIENGDRVYWFLAPEVNNVSPAMFKKIIHTNVKGESETKTVSQCDAPKQTCDDLMKKFKTLSEKYK